MNAWCERPWTTTTSDEDGWGTVTTNPEVAVSAPAASAAGRASLRRTLSAGLVGTLIEYFDFLVYASISALVFGDLFFPGDNAFVSTMLVWITFAVGYIARPLGGIVCGHFGDRIGRSKVLMATIATMGVTTTVIGLLPSYDQIGMAAPIILLAMRFLQGLAVGGEYGGATLAVVEHAHGQGRRGFFGGLLGIATSGGTMLGTGAVALLTYLASPAQLAGWAWRIPFLASAVLIFLGFYIRTRLEEPPAMKERIEEGRTERVPLLKVFREHPRELIVSLTAPIGSFTTYYVIIAFSIPYVLGVHEGAASYLYTVSTVALLFYLGGKVLTGWISDRIGRRIPMAVGAGGLAVWMFAFFPLLLQGSVWAAVLGFVVALLLHAGMAGPNQAYLAELFSTEVRYSGVSFGWQICAAVAGGLTPLVATWLVHATGSWVSVAVFVAVSCAITVAALLLGPDRYREDLAR
jgi:MFS family permease